MQRPSREALVEPPTSPGSRSSRAAPPRLSHSDLLEGSTPKRPGSTCTVGEMWDTSGLGSSSLADEIGARLSVRTHPILSSIRPTEDLEDHHLRVTESHRSQDSTVSFYLLLVLSAVLSSTLSFGVDEVVSLMGQWRGQVNSRGPVYLGHSFGWIWESLLAFAICVPARLLVRSCQEAQGSGIPEVKTMLFGQIELVRKFLQLRVLWIKTLALTAVVGSGLPIGKEGPFVHLASCITANLDPTFFEKSPSAVSPLLLASVAVGVGTTFSAPLGGVIFALELMLPQVYDTAAYLGCFMASISGAVVYAMAKTYSTGSSNGIVALMSTDVSPGDGVPRHAPVALILLNVVLGMICGVLGGFFIKMHKRTQAALTAWRARGQAAPKPPQEPKKGKNRLGAPLLERQGSLPINWAASEDHLFRNRGWRWRCHNCNPCRGWHFEWRDLFQVGLVALLNAAVSENLPLLRGGTTMPQLLCKLFSKNLHSDASNWIISGLNCELSLLVLFVVKWFLSIIALALPIPTGIVAPTMVIGAFVGRCYYNIIPTVLVEAILDPGDGTPVTEEMKGAFAARFAIVGAAAFCSAVARAFSMAITVFEVLALPGSVLPLSCASLAALHTANQISPGFFDQILLNKGWLGIQAIASREKAMKPALKVMRRIEDHHAECVPSRACLHDLERLLQGVSEKHTYPIVQHVRFDRAGEERLGWHEPLLVATCDSTLLRSVLERHEGCDRDTVVDFLNPLNFTKEDLAHIARAPRHVDAKTSVQDVFLLLKIMSTSTDSTDAEPVVYVTSNGRLLGSIAGEELLGKQR